MTDRPSKDRLSRAERRTLQREDERLLALPLPGNRDARAAAAHVRHMTHLLGRPTAASPCSDTIAHIGAVLERTLPPVASIACRRGCSHCCVQTVTVSAPEVFFVAAQIRSRAAAIARVNAADAVTHDLSQEQRLAAHSPCPLLENNLCSVYAARPLGCRGFVSIDLNACIATFDNGAPPQIPMPGAYVDILYACRMLLVAALRLKGFKDASYELNAALAAALAQDDTEARWLAGEDVFANVPTTGAIPPAFDKAITDLVAYVAPTV